MISSPDSTTAAHSPAPVPRTRQRTGRHVAAIVIGGLALLPGLGMLAGGTALAVGQAVATDDNGYFTATLDRIESDGVAVASTDLFTEDIDADEPWVLDWLDLDVRLRVDGAGSTDDVFVGVARTADIAAYLDDAPHTVVVDIDDHTPRYRQVGGSELVPPVGSPLDQDFWVATASGSGEQELTWQARGGRWSIVVMNADGSPGVAADVQIGGRSDAITPIAVTLLAIGGIVVLTGVALIVYGARGRRVPGAPGTTVGTLLPPPMPEPATPLDHDELGVSG
jgi:hypothetical protein